MASLFSTFILKNKNVRNRIVMPPMVCFGWAGNDGIVSERHIRHYEARAKGGAGMIIVEAACVDSNERLSNTQLGIWTDEQIPGLEILAKTSRNLHVFTLIQIHNAGINRDMEFITDKEGSSGMTGNERTEKVFSLEDIETIKKQFISAAIRAEKAGFDGVELHAAHGYLLNQFHSPFVNHRKDDYGGNLENRLRLINEIIQGIKAVTGKDFIIGCRLGGNDPDLETGIQMAINLEKAGIDLLHVSHSGFSDYKPEVPEGFPGNWIVYTGSEIKKHLKIPVIVVNGIREPKTAEKLISGGYADFTAIGQGFLTDPEWANKAKEHREIKRCLECKPSCRWFKQADNCPKR